MKISVVINTKNAAKTLPLALLSVKWADEIIVMDMHSSDETVKIAKKVTEHVFTHPDMEYVEPARNAALAKATGDWILILDADEEVMPALAKRLQEIVTETDAADCYYLPRRNEIFGAVMTHTGWWPDYQLRFFRKGSVEWSDRIHSVPLTKGAVVELPAKVSLALLHHNYPTVESYLERLNRYTTIQAANRGAVDGVETDMILRQFRQEFISRFFASAGHRDGARGAGLSLLQALYEVVVELKRWQLGEFAEVKVNSAERTELLRNELATWLSDLAYWRADWEMQQSTGLAKWWWRVRRWGKW
jgi:glycosyltransferase involved in cell wall biosynthesis